jgi:hypothetical protein
MVALEYGVMGVEVVETLEDLARPLLECPDGETPRRGGSLQWRGHGPPGRPVTPAAAARES